MANLDNILKSRDITLPTKVHLVKAMVFPIVTYGYESWAIKKAECWRIDAFELWCWRKLLRVPWTARRSNQSILKEISLNIHRKDWCWSWNSNTLATWCEEPTYWKRPWCWKKLKVGGERDNRGWDGWMASLTQWTWVWVTLGAGNGQGGLVCCSPWGHKESDMEDLKKDSSHDCHNSAMHLFRDNQNHSHKKNGNRKNLRKVHHCTSRLYA